MRSDQLNQEVRMKAKAIAVAAVLGVAALGLSSPPANAAGCLKGALLGGVAGHFAGQHGLLGASAGCLIGRHYANRSASQQMGRTQTKTVTTDKYETIPYTTTARREPVTRDRYETIVRRQPATTMNRYETTGYGSSYPQLMR
jgi:hypothetical protein